ncbi:hypothetical protein CBL_12098 [Carabus blaptoides fortunei]
MSGSFKGVQAIIEEKYPAAIYVHCNSSLNLAHSCMVQNISNWCETRWMENHDGLIRFTEVFKPILETLEELKLVKDIETSLKALQFLRAIMTSEFIVTVEHVDTAISQVQEMRIDIDLVFSNIFEKAETLIKSIDDQECIKIPRTVVRIFYQNLRDIVGETEMMSDGRMVSRGGKKDSTVENVIVELPGKARKHLVNEGKVYVEWQAFKVREFEM